MRDLSSNNFGLIIAYLLPGFVTLWAARPIVPGLDGWLAIAPNQAPTVGGFLYVTLGSAAAGMFISTVRWAVLDTLHHKSGIPVPAWDFSRFPATMAAFDSLVQDHFRYYQHYGHMLVAVVFAYASSTLTHRPVLAVGVWEHAVFIGIGLALYIGSRDALRKYYERTAAVLNSPEGPVDLAIKTRIDELGRNRALLAPRARSWRARRRNEVTRKE